MGPPHAGPMAKASLASLKGRHWPRCTGVMILWRYNSVSWPFVHVCDQSASPDKDDVIQSKMANFTVRGLDNTSLVGDVILENNETCAEHIQATAYRLHRLHYAICYISLALRVPGNLLSAIVWLRRHVTGRNTSAIYLAALAINDLVFTMCNGLYFLYVDCDRNTWLCTLWATLWFLKFCLSSAFPSSVSLPFFNHWRFAHLFRTLYAENLLNSAIVPGRVSWKRESRCFCHQNSITVKCITNIVTRYSREVTSPIFLVTRTVLY